MNPRRSRTTGTAAGERAVSRQVRTVVLTERRSAVRRLPRADVDDLARHFRHVVDVTPTFDRGVYRLTARGYVGSFRTANVRWEVRPKLPWESLRWLTGDRSAPGGLVADDPGSVGGLADLLAGRLADLIRERAEAGLLRDYAECQTREPTVRGRIDLPRQLRDAGTPSLFHLVADEFTPDVVWNRLPKAAARRLLDHAGTGNGGPRPPGGRRHRVRECLGYCPFRRGAGPAPVRPPVGTVPVARLLEPAGSRSFRTAG